MSVLVWLAFPLVAMLLAIAWTAWANRPRGPVAPQESVAEYERFRAALAHAERPGG